MAQVFLSYASEDRETAAVLAGALRNRGLSVWWDRNIPLGRTFDEVIQEQLEAAGCVVVLWSPASTASRWVRAEAGDADARNVLVPVLIAECRIPLPFRQIQTANLIDWRGRPNHPGFEAVMEVVSAHLRLAPRRSAASPPPPPRADSGSNQNRQPAPVPRREEPPASPFRSIVAVLAGFAFLIAAFLPMSALLEDEPSSFDPFGFVELMETTVVWGLLLMGAGWVIARLAPRRLVGHALVMGTILQVLALLLIGPSFSEQPSYTLLPFFLSIPCAYAGARIRECQLARRHAPARQVARQAPAGSGGGGARL